MTSRCSCGVTFIEESCQGMRKLQNCKAAGDNRVVELWWRGIDKLFVGAHANCIVVCSNLIVWKEVPHGTQLAFPEIADK